MSNQNQEQTNAARLQKRSQFSTPNRPGRARKIAFLGLALAAVGAGAYFLGGSANGQATSAKPIVATPGPASVRIPLAELGSGKARFFDFKAAGDKTVRFFVLKSSDGVYRAALDACDVCYQGRKGYSQDGDDMVCRKCGRHFPSVKVNDVTGGCNPIGVPRTIADGHLVVAASDLEAGKMYF